MLWYHWAAIIVGLISFLVWIGIKFGVDVSDFLFLPLVFLLD